VSVSPALLDRAEALLGACRAKGWRVSTAESCTGGLVAALLTEIAGSSDVVECGFVTYSNGAKAAMLGVDPSLIETKGAVSAEVARAMADGALARTGVELAVAITGIAGPGGATDTKPVGLVHFGLAKRGEPVRHLERRYGALERAAVRDAALGDALGLLEAAVRA
jgi:nicotinamide-nucleotide amidase